MLKFVALLPNLFKYLETNENKGYPISSNHYPVLYMHDGQNLLRDQDAIGGDSLSLEKGLDYHNA